MRRRGSLFIEVLLSIVLFSVGVLGLMSVMTLGLKMINKSGNTIIADQILINTVEDYMLSSVISHDVTPSGSGVQKITASPVNFSIGGFNLKYSLYRYTRPGKVAVYFDILQREK